ncbi:SRPBCC family protein [Nocardia callitridis]|uniref:Polyketide cyclase /reductase n=1 Tax=Nocardia callitridis TaxID=648753 RepID=A0ABP9KTZ1_9NOCA
MSNSKIRRRTALLLVPLAAVVLTACGNNDESAEQTQAAPAAPTSSPAASAADQAPLSCEGQTIDTAAPIHYRAETLIKAPLSKVWSLHTDVERWSQWQDAVATIERLDQGPLRPGSQFHWTTPVPATNITPAATLSITSSIQNIEENKCTRWTGPAESEAVNIDSGTHVWNFTEVDGGVLVRTEENWRGAQAEADVPTSINFLGEGLEVWLAALKAKAEAAN